MKLYKYKNKDEYVSSQVKAAMSKRGQVWSQPAEIQYLSNYLLDHNPNLSFGICHGVRNGWEVLGFSCWLPVVNVIGTEISSAGNNIDKIIQWDFHDIKTEWIGKTDFIYSNSFDHSYKPEYCLAQWMKCLSASGRCIIQWNDRVQSDGGNIIDCFAASKDDFFDLFSRDYNVVDILDIPGKRNWNKGATAYWFVIMNRSEKHP